MMNDYDVLIAGSGVAGLYAALNFAPEVRVLVLSKKERMLCNSALARGGCCGGGQRKRRFPSPYRGHADRRRV